MPEPTVPPAPPRSGSAPWPLGSGIGVAIVLVGALLRFGLAWVNPPGNTFDDHLEPIARLATELRRLEPDECWQCYQPPAYYLAAAATLRGLGSLGVEPRHAWKGVQWLGAAASSVSLALIWLLLARLPGVTSLPRLGALALLALLPRDLYAAAAIGNDSWLEMAVSIAALGFALFWEARRPRTGLALLVVGVVLAAWTKQSGLVTLILLGLAWVRPRASRAARGLLLAAALLALGDEAWRTARSGVLLVSNQHFDYRAGRERQPPGRIEAETFLTFRIGELMRRPTLAGTTVDSFWTQIFARFWFDYEPRFLPPTPAMHGLARALYGLGLGALAALLAGGLWVARRGALWERGVLLLLPAFLGAAVLQTLRFPHFSSMKAVFVLPAACALALATARGLQLLAARPSGVAILRGFLGAALLVGLLHWGAAVAGNRAALVAPTSSPLWTLPAVPAAR